MKYYAKCNNINNKDEIHLQDSDGNILYIIKKESLKKSRAIDIMNVDYLPIFHVNISPLKIKGRYQVFDNLKTLKININLGFHLLHKVEIGTKRLVCKANLFKIKYWLYEGDTVIGRLAVVKKQDERYFEISLEKNDDMINVIALYVIAQAQRINFLRKDK